LIDTSLEGAIRGARPDEQERLAHLSDQLRQLLRDSGRFSLVDLGSILARRYHADRTRGAGKQPVAPLRGDAANAGAFGAVARPGLAVGATPGLQRGGG